MALLKSGSTVGGSLIWHQGILPLFPATDSLYYKNFKIYSEKDKPSKSDVGLGNVTNDAQVKKAGDTMLGTLKIDPPGATNAELWLNNAKIRANDGNALVLGGGRNSVFIRPQDDAQSSNQFEFNPDGTAYFYNLRMRAGQNGNADSVTRKDYVDTQIKSSADTKVNKSGDTVTGTLNVKADIIVDNTVAYRSKDSGGNNRYLARIVDSNISEFGDNQIQMRLRSKGNPTLFHGTNNTEYTLYHTGNKPNKNDVGLNNLSNDPQVKWLNLAGSNGATKYFRLIVTAPAGDGQRQAQFSIHGMNNYGSRDVYTDVISFSSRGASSSGNNSQAITDSQLRHYRTGQAKYGESTETTGRVGMVKTGSVMELWLEMPKYCAGAKLEVHHIMGLELKIEDRGTAGPTSNIFWATPVQAFTNMSPPTAREVDAVSAKEGGEFKKEVQFTGGIKIPLTVSNSVEHSRNGIYPGNADGAAFDKANIDIKSWYGIGFASTQGTNGRTVFINARTGDIGMKGKLIADGVITSPTFVMTASQSTQGNSATRRDYVDNQISTLNTNLSKNITDLDKKLDDRKVNRAGDTMTGSLEIKGGLTVNNSSRIKGPITLSPVSNNNDWASINFRHVDGTTNRGIVFADASGNIGFSNMNGKNVIWNPSNYFIIQEGELNVGHNAGGNGEANHDRNKANFYNKGSIDCAGTRAYQDQNDGNRWIREVRGTRHILQGTDLGSENIFVERVGQRHFHMMHVFGAGSNGWFEFRNNGDMSCNGALYARDVNITSDIRHKRKLVRVEDSERILGALKAYNYEVKDHTDDTKWSKSTGLIAQDALGVLPSAVDTTDKDHYKLNYNAIVAVLVEQVNKLTERVKELEK